MKKYIISSLIFILLVGGSYWLYQDKSDVVGFFGSSIKSSGNNENSDAYIDSNNNGQSAISGGTNNNGNIVSIGRDVTGEGLDQADQQVTPYDVDPEAEQNEAIEELAEPMQMFSHSGELKNIKSGQVMGIAQAVFDGQSYNLLAEFGKLTDAGEGFFYEGWVVRVDPLEVVSTGRVEKNNSGNYQNIFSSGRNLIDHSFFVLTLEPDDNNPAPAEHILEGNMEKI